MVEWVNKHSPIAYQGKMQRLTFSKILQDMVYDIYELPEYKMKEEYSEGEQLLALQDRARNEALNKAIDIIEEAADRVLNSNKEDIKWFWNIEEWKTDED